MRSALLLAIAVFLMTPRGSLGAPTAALRSIESLLDSTPCRETPVRIEGVVTHILSGQYGFFMQQNGAGIFVQNPGKIKLSPGDAIAVEGIVQCSERPSLSATLVRLLGHGILPRPAAATFHELIIGQQDAALVTVRGTVRSADANSPHDAMPQSAIVHVQTDDGPVDVLLQSANAATLGPLLDTEVEATGVAAGNHDGKMQRIGVLLYADTLKNIHVLRKAPASPLNLPITPMNSILAGYKVQDRSRRIRVRGTITYIEPGTALVLQDGTRSLWVNTNTHQPLAVGDEADVIGFPNVDDGLQILTFATLQPTGKKIAVTPQPMNWSELSSRRHFFDLVTIEGTVVMETGGATQDEYVMTSGGNRFTAIYRHGNRNGATDPVKIIPVGAHIRVTGICAEDGSGPENNSIPFNILLRSPADIELIGSPPLINIPNLLIALLVLFFALAGIVIRFVVIERNVRRQTTTLAYSERRRSHILEQINGDTPLAEIIEQTTELVSYRLHGAPCWVKVDRGAQLGNAPAQRDGLRIRECAIPSRSGDSLGSIYAAFDLHAKTHSDEDEALALAAGLIELAIETRKLYSDLRHRSEFDQLTDVQNRFALERSLDAQIRYARNTAGIFGVVYLDLNDFKQVNDVYGHGVGDLYLQQIALRLKQQLRPGDVLARLGGDEFVILVANVHNRAEVEEIAKRLEHCFDEHFDIGHYKVEGSASLGIAVYPEDARGRESLISAADAAMYTVKHARART